MPEQLNFTQDEDQAWTPPFADVMQRLALCAGIKTQSELARALGVTPSSVTDAKQRGQFPLSWAVRLARKQGLSLDLILGISGESNAVALDLTQRFPAQWTMPRERDDVRRLRIEDAPDRPQVDLVWVNKARARLSAGTGSLEIDADPVGLYAFRRDWLSAKGSPSGMVLMDVVGDSMEPDIRNGDMVLIDQAQRDVIGGAIYAVGVEETVYVKRVDLLPGQLSLGSINKTYDPIIIDMRGDLADTVRIIGRVIWWCREAR